MPKAMHSKQRARIAKRKEKGMTEKAENDNRAARNHERAIMHMLVRRKHPKHGGLDSARVDDIAKALETPDPLPSTPEEIEADLQRRGTAMEEINAAIERLPDKEKRAFEILRARKPHMTRYQQGGEMAPSAIPTMDKSLLSPRKAQRRAPETGHRDRESVEDHRHREPYSVTKEEWEEGHWNKVGVLQEGERRQDYEAEEAERKHEHEEFMKKMMAEIEEAERI